MARVQANGWSGAQYSLLRCGWGAGLALHFAASLAAGAALLVSAPSAERAAAVGTVAVAAAATVLSLALALGWRDRAAAVVLLWVCLGSASAAALPPAAGLATVWFLAVHLFVPSSPYGSLGRAATAPPAMFWNLPAASYRAVWLGVAALHGWNAAVAVAAAPQGWSPVLGVLEGAIAVAAIALPARPALWVAAAGVALFLVGASAAGTAAAVSPVPGATAWPVLALHAAAFDPAWVGPRADEPAREGPLWIFYDGGCGLCHRFVRFALSEDRDGLGFRFAPLSADRFARMVSASARSGLPDSVVVVRPDGGVRARSGAMIEVGRRLGGLWRIGAEALALWPRRWADAGYDFIASRRKRWFAAPGSACPVLPPYLRGRFSLPASQG